MSKVRAGGATPKNKRLTAADWNALHPIGTPVMYKSHPYAEPFASKTRSEAWELGHGEPVVSIEGKTGGVCLWALTVWPE